MRQWHFVNGLLGIPLTEVPEALRRFHPVLAGPQALVFRYGRGSGAADEILAAVRSAGLLVRDLTTSQADLEQVFLDLLRRS